MDKSKIKTKVTQNITEDRSIMLETRTLYAFIGCESIWCMIMAATFFALGLIPPAITFLILLFFIVPLGFGLKLEKYRNFFKNYYMLMVFLSIPFVWYISGGNASSASALFLVEPILFALTNRGIRQKVYILLSMVSTSVIYVLVDRFPNVFSGFRMTDRQHYFVSIAMGSSIVVWVSFLIYFQKKEYLYEYNRADEMTEEYKRSNKMQKNFLANMSHEIRSPLGVVLGFNTLIKDSEDIAQIHEYSASIESAGKTLHTVINDILDYSKIEAGKLDIIEGDYDFPDVISDIRHAIKLRADEKGLEFLIEEKSPMPKYLYGDNIRLRQCLLNLLTNAVKYTDEGSVTLRMSDTVSSEGESKIHNLVFEVADTGRGIPEDLIPHLFTAFQRLDEGQNRGIEGTGLGLAITKSLLDEMNGSILVKSTVGVGSTFTVMLTQKEGTGNNSIDDSSLALLNLTGIRVLLVDDTAVNLKLMEKVLGKMNVIVRTADNGKEALTICRNEKFDVILLDHMMPEMDGVETFRRLKEQKGINDKTPVIMLTANAMAGAKQEYLEIGFEDYISKPVDMKDLKKKIYYYAKKKNM